MKAVLTKQRDVLKKKKKKGTFFQYNKLCQDCTRMTCLFLWGGKKQAQQKLSFFSGNNTHESRYSDISWNVASRAACKNLAKWMTVRHHSKPSHHWTSGSHSLASQKWAAWSEDRTRIDCPCFISYIRNSCMLGNGRRQWVVAYFPTVQSARFRQLLVVSFCPFYGNAWDLN